MALVAWLVLAGVATVAAVAFGIGLGVPARLPHGTRGVLLRWGHAVVWAETGRTAQREARAQRHRR